MKQGSATALAITGWAALVGLLSAVLPPGAQWDGFQLYTGAKALLAGGDPYAAVSASGFPWALYYPLPAVLLMVPLAAFPETVARILWACATGAVFGLAARGKALAAGALSGVFLACLILGQVAPLLTAAAVVPGLGFLWATKPSLGLALFVAYPSRRALLGMAALTLVSLALRPEWPAHWLATLGSMPQRAPLMMPGGFLLLLGLLRWRRPEGRLLAALACVPHGVYDAVALFLVPKTLRQGLMLAAISMAGVVVSHLLWPWQPGGDVAHRGRWLVALGSLYLPALVLVLRLREDVRSEELERGRAGVA